jgi:patatin-like phospholipase/acyl hydrolase
MINRIEEQVPGFLSRVDMIAGTSSGGIVALLLAAGHGPNGCLDLWRGVVNKVFQPSLYRMLNPFVSRYSGFEKVRVLPSQGRSPGLSHTMPSGPPSPTPTCD